MAQFKDLDEFFDDSLRLPVGGVTYVIPPPDAETGLLCHRLWAAGLKAANGVEVDAAQLGDDAEQDMYQRVLGPVYDQMLDAGVTWPKIKHVGVTAFLWVVAGDEHAAAYWAHGDSGDQPGEAVAPNRAARRAAASTTRSRGSTSGTSPARSTKATAKRSAGKTS